MRMFLEKFHIQKLKVTERLEMLQWFSKAMDLNFCDEKPYDALQRVAAKTETFLYGDIDTLVHFALRESYLKQLEKSTEFVPSSNLCDVREEDFNTALG